MTIGGLAKSSLYPLADRDALKAYFVGRPLTDIDTPGAIIDVSKAKVNCASMLNAVERLGVKFRAHVKSHKTTELTRLQVGSSSEDVRLVTSTVIEAESLIPYLKECQRAGRTVSVLYGVPCPQSSVGRLAHVATELGRGSLAVMIDHPDQIATCSVFKLLTGFPVGVFCKVDTGYHRAGIPPTTDGMVNLLKLIADEELAGKLVFHGFYSHAGDSYEGNAAGDAMKRLAEEINLCMVAAQHCSTESRKFTISVGATPTAVSIENLNNLEDTELSTAIASAKTQFELEVHAGVYPLLDMQQISTHARSEKTVDDIAFTVLAEVSSLYPERERPEALIAAGSLSLGRELCKDYSGYGVVTPWNTPYTLPEDPMNESLIVAKISQEHGILAHAKNDNSSSILALKVGQKIRIWPNHACIAGAGFGWYFIVDSQRDPTGSTIVDIWDRWRGW